MKMRLISLALVVVMVGIALTGCTTTTEAATNNPFAGRFSMHSVGDSAYVLVDRVEGCVTYTPTRSAEDVLLRSCLMKTGIL